MAGRLTVVALTGLALALAGCGKGSSELSATGSSTVFPFTSAVGAAFVQAESGRKPPKIESTGTGAGFQRFCEGSGSGKVDIANASRRMTRAEFAKCQAAKVGDIVEAPIGLDGIALAESNSGPKLALTRKDIYLALAAEPLGKPNGAKTWRDVNPALPAIAIRVLGPPATSGTRDAFVELMLEQGCVAANPDAQTLRMRGDPAAFDRLCRRIRGDGAYVEEGEDDTVIVAGLARDPNALGLIGYSYLEENRAKLHGVSIDGVAPASDAIASGKYPGARSLYLYVKKKHLEAKPDLKAFLDLYATMAAPGGALAKQGLIPLPDKARERAARAIAQAQPLDVEALP